MKFKGSLNKTLSVLVAMSFSIQSLGFAAETLTTPSQNTQTMPQENATGVTMNASAVDQQNMMLGMTQTTPDREVSIQNGKEYYDVQNRLTKRILYYTGTTINKEITIFDVTITSRQAIQKVQALDPDGRLLTETVYDTAKNAVSTKTTWVYGSILGPVNSVVKDTYDTTTGKKVQSEFSYKDNPFFGTIWGISTFDSNEKIKTSKSYAAKGDATALYEATYTGGQIVNDISRIGGITISRSFASRTIGGTSMRVPLIVSYTSGSQWTRETFTYDANGIASSVCVDPNTGRRMYSKTYQNGKLVQKIDYENSVTNGKTKVTDFTEISEKASQLPKVVLTAAMLYWGLNTIGIDSMLAASYETFDPVTGAKTGKVVYQYIVGIRRSTTTYDGADRKIQAEFYSTTGVLSSRYTYDAATGKETKIETFVNGVLDKTVTKIYAGNILTGESTKNGAGQMLSRKVYDTQTGLMVYDFFYNAGAPNGYDFYDRVSTPNMLIVTKMRSTGIIEKDYYNTTGGATTISAIEYFTNGVVTTRRNYGSGGVLTGIEVTKYDAQNRMTEKNFFDAASVLKEKHIFDATGALKEKHIYVNGSSQANIIEYYSNGALVSKEERQYTGSILTLKVIKDAAGTVTEAQGFDQVSGLIAQLTKFANGKKSIEETYTYTNGKMTKKVVDVYGSYGAYWVIQTKSIYDFTSTGLVSKYTYYTYPNTLLGELSFAYPKFDETYQYDNINGALVKKLVTKYSGYQSISERDHYEYSAVVPGRVLKYRRDEMGGAMNYEETLYYNNAGAVIQKTIVGPYANLYQEVHTLKSDGSGYNISYTINGVLEPYVTVQVIPSPESGLNVPIKYVTVKNSAGTAIKKMKYYNFGRPVEAEYYYANGVVSTRDTYYTNYVQRRSTFLYPASGVVNEEHQYQYYPLSNELRETATIYTNKSDGTLNHKIYYDRNLNNGALLSKTIYYTGPNRTEKITYDSNGNEVGPHVWGTW